MSPIYVDLICILIDDDALISTLRCKFWRKQMGWWRKQNPLSCKSKLTILRSDFNAVSLIVYKYSGVNIKTQGRMALIALHESYSLPVESFQSLQICKSSNSDWEKVKGHRRSFFSQRARKCVLPFTIDPLATERSTREEGGLWAMRRLFRSVVNVVLQRTGSLYHLLEMQENKKHLAEPYIDQTGKIRLDSPKSPPEHPKIIW